MRLRRVELLGYRSRKAVPPAARPDDIRYATNNLSRLVEYADPSHEIDVKVYGHRTGYIRYRRTTAGLIEKTYVGFSDDGLPTTRAGRA